MDVLKFDGLKKSLFGLIRSRKFFYIILLLFVIESVWIAFSALYPQAFDEDFHFGLIRMYSHYWLPFLSHQPANADVYGAVTRDPSFFYHYLMSFPYRFLNLFVHTQEMMVIAMRLINVAIFTGGLVLFRKVLLRVGLSVSLASISLLVFILIPIVPQLAAQVNYDNLIFLLTAWVCLQTFDITDQIKKNRLSAKSLLLLSVTIGFATITKYAFLPIAFSAIAFLVIYAFRHFRGHIFRQLVKLKADFFHQPLWVKTVLPIMLLIAFGLFAQRDGYNLVKYHSFVPDCSKVLSVKQCNSYSTWSTDYYRHNQLTSGQITVQDNFFLYGVKWFYWMGYRLFFAVNGPASGFYSYPPLLLPAIGAVILALACLLAVFKWRVKLFHDNPYLLFLLAVSVVYGVSLFTKGYATYKYTAYMENENGRYLLPILFPIAAISGLALSQTLRRSQTKKLVAALVIVVLLLEGGGGLTFILSSDSSWYWPNPTVVKVNTTAQKIAGHVVIKKKR